MATVAVMGLTVGPATAGTGPLDLLADSWFDASASADGSWIAYVSDVTTDELEETFAGGSGLQNLGNGDYQLNWKTPTTYAGSCKTMVLDLGGGVTVRADFRFTK
jgi:hypothetical protein